VTRLLDYETALRAWANQDPNGIVDVRLTRRALEMLLRRTDSSGHALFRLDELNRMHGELKAALPREARRGEFRPCEHEDDLA
jgi:hypothetical protein